MWLIPAVAIQPTSPLINLPLVLCSKIRIPPPEILDYFTWLFIIDSVLNRRGNYAYSYDTRPYLTERCPDPEHHPCLYEGDGENGLEIYFENEENKRIYMEMELEDKKVLKGNDSADYVAEG